VVVDVLVEELGLVGENVEALDGIRLVVVVVEELEGIRLLVENLGVDFELVEEEPGGATVDFIC